MVYRQEQNKTSTPTFKQRISF